jgi:hypothetical protein
MEKLTLGDISSPVESPICYDLYCGLGGWGEGFLSEGFRCIGYDIEKHDYGTGTYPGELILADVRSIHGSQLADAACIVASPPCQEPSYRAMPWKRAKALNAIGPPHNFIELFNACFRIQREASEAAGRYIPLVVENVRGAQIWVGPSAWNYGSYHLWGDIPALMPMTKAFKSYGMNWSDRTRHGQDFTRIAGQQAEGRKGKGSWFGDYQEQKKRNDHLKQGGDWFGKGADCSISRRCSSKSKGRKAASAEIAKIPFPLAQWIARCYKPAVPASLPLASLPSSGQAGVPR